MILLIDNYDSFTFNLYQYLGELGEETAVVRNDAISIAEIQEFNPKAIILSPGPGRPEDAGICIEAVQNFFDKYPILGICLGHQVIGESFGGSVRKASQIKHGKTSFITHCGDGIFRFLPSPLEVMRYHSLAIENSTIPKHLEAIAKSMDDNEIMAIRHMDYPVFGLQFHPESIGTPFGKQLLKNFLFEIERERDDETIFTPIS